MLYIDGEMTINFSGLSAGSVVIDRVVMPADSLLTFRRSGGEKITIRELYTTQSSVIIGLDHAAITNGVTVYEPIVEAVEVKRISSSEATVTFTSDETGSYYYMVTDRWMEEPQIDTSGEGEPCIADEELTLHLTGACRRQAVCVRHSKGYPERGQLSGHDLHSRLSRSAPDGRRQPSGIVGDADDREPLRPDGTGGEPTQTGQGRMSGGTHQREKQTNAHAGSLFSGMGVFSAIAAVSDVFL